MFRLVLAISSLAIVGMVPVSAAKAQSRTALECVKFDENRQATADQHLGWIRNVCAEAIAVIHDFGLNQDGSPRQGLWCASRVSSVASLQGATLLDPDETMGIGVGLKGVARKLYWAACTVDTSSNNSVNFIQQEPRFRFLPDCNYECE